MHGYVVIAFDVIFLQHKLMKQAEMVNYLQSRIKQAVQQKDFFNDLNDTVIENLADIYSNSISQFRYKVQIVGKAEHVRNPKVFHKIRALLLSGIRAAVLWQQLGGRRWHLSFPRTSLVKETQKLLSSLTPKTLGE